MKFNKLKKSDHDSHDDAASGKQKRTEGINFTNHKPKGLNSSKFGHLQTKVLTIGVIQSEQLPTLKEMPSNDP